MSFFINFIHGKVKISSSIFKVVLIMLGYYLSDHSQGSSSTPSARLLTRSTRVSIRLSTHSTRPSAGSIFLSSSIFVELSVDLFVTDQSFFKIFRITITSHQESIISRTECLKTIRNIREIVVIRLRRIRCRKKKPFYFS